MTKRNATKSKNGYLQQPAYTKEKLFFLFSTHDRIRSARPGNSRDVSQVCERNRNSFYPQ